MSFFNSFLFYDLVFLILFSTFIFIFLYKRRKKLDREGWLFLYRTSWGIKLINSVGTKYKKPLNAIAYLAVACGYFLMVGMVYLLGKIVYWYATIPELAKVTKIPPVMPLIPYLPSIFKLDFLPPFYFTYWIVIIAIIAIVHEFGHGIWAKVYDVHIKSTGFGFLGPFLAAFVEPDEKQMQEKKIFPQLAILASGTFMNILTAVLFLLVMWLFFVSVFSPAGVTFDTYSFSQVPIASITAVNGVQVIAPSSENILKIMNDGLNELESGTTSYLSTKEMVSSQNDGFFLFLYNDAPAIRSNISGAITSINDVNVYNKEELSAELLKYSPGDVISITTSDGENIETKEVTLESNPLDPTKPYLGIGYNIQQNRGGIEGKIYSLITSFKKPNVFYEPIINPELATFIYNLFWWIILISISVALVNMIPASIFDGGRFFYLTMLAIFKNQNVAKRISSLVAWLILLAVILMMFFYSFSFFI